MVLKSSGMAKECYLEFWSESRELSVRAREQRLALHNAVLPEMDVQHGYGAVASACPTRRVTS